jgi:hypothetical protein
MKDTMRTLSLSLTLLFVTVLGPAPRAQQATPDQVEAPFSDPSRVGTLKVGIVTGSITVKASTRKDVLIVARARGEGPRRSTDSGGLRRLSQVGGFQVEEEGNEMTVTSHSPNRAIDFDIEVPTRTNLELSSVNGGDIVVEGVDGELEIMNVNGAINLTGVSGSVVANTTNGKLVATLRRLTAQKAMAFTTLNGNVDVTLPAATRATFKLRSDQGDVFTDFEMQVRSTGPSVQDTRRQGGRFQIEVNKAIYGAVNGGGPEFEMRTFNGNIYVRKGP